VLTMQSDCAAELHAALSNADTQISDRILARGIPDDARIGRASPRSAGVMSGAAGQRSRIEYATGRPSASPCKNVWRATEEMHLPDFEVERPRRIARRYEVLPRCGGGDYA
jgi:hypothetical protein